jgi:hypothetical protein
MSSNRPRSSSPKRSNPAILSDEEYAKEIKWPDNGTFLKNWTRPKILYVVIQTPNPDLHGESTEVYSIYPSGLQAMALTCLSTSQRQSSLQSQSQTKRIAQLLFHSVLFDEEQIFKYKYILPAEIQWFKKVFSVEIELFKKTFFGSKDTFCTSWNAEFNGMGRINGFLYPMPIILRPDFYKLD